MPAQPWPIVWNLRRLCCLVCTGAQPPEPHMIVATFAAASARSWSALGPAGVATAKKAEQTAMLTAAAETARNVLRMMVDRLEGSDWSIEIYGE